MKASYRKRLFQLFLNIDFIWALSKKEFKNKYSGSKLGVWWALILPLVLAFSINMVFTKVFKVSIPNYTLFVLSAILPWIFFSQSLSEATNSFINSSSILKQRAFPKEIVPISSILGNFLNFVLGLAVIMPLFILFNCKILLFVPLLIILLIFFLFFLLGLGLIFSLINVFYRDISCFLSLGLMLWFWVTPVFYSLEMVPYPYRIIGLVNPLSYFMVNFRDVLFYGHIDLYMILTNGFISLLFYLGGYYIFLRGERELSKRL
ncbi:MAG: ABC transporter permease [Candidatus Omnitrophica bacterium]|nr:ABC transporter permease [Candidatus Omnitrophota bacterium]MBU1853184.1 ABC transporter permease [Candidatus Omnitrophota bacterium]